MAKKLALVIALLFVCSPVFAGPRNPLNNSEGETVYTDLGVGGFDGGAPGYLKFTDTNQTEYYLWVGTDGKLRYASGMVLSYSQTVNTSRTTAEAKFLGASPTTLTWTDASGMVVGTQTINQ